MLPINMVQHMEAIRPLDQISFDELYTAWNDAFKDYARSWTKDELQNMLQRRGYSPALSFGAFDDGQLVSFTLNAVDDYKGIKTAYDTGTGTITSHRGKGLAKQIFEASVPYLKAAGTKQYLLEVLKENTTAISIYESAGFTVSRILNYSIANTAEVPLLNKPLPIGYSLRETEIDAIAMAAMWDFEPAWQNSLTSINRGLDGFTIIGAYVDNQLVGYGIIEGETGDIPQLAVSVNHRRKGIGTALLKALLQHNKHATLRFINTDATCTTMTDLLAANGIAVSGQQYEMVKAID